MQKYKAVLSDTRCFKRLYVLCFNHLSIAGYPCILLHTIQLCFSDQRRDLHALRHCIYSLLHSVLRDRWNKKVSDSKLTLWWQRKAALVRKSRLLVICKHIYISNILLSIDNLSTYDLIHWRQDIYKPNCSSKMNHNNTIQCYCKSYIKSYDIIMDRVNFCYFSFLYMLLKEIEVHY